MGSNTFIVQKDSEGPYIVVDLKDGKILAELDCDYIAPSFNSGYYLISKNGDNGKNKFQIIDLYGKPTSGWIECEGSNNYKSRDAIFVYPTDIQEYDAVNKYGIKVLPSKYNEIWITHGVIMCREQRDGISRIGVYDEKGNEILPVRYFSSGGGYLYEGLTWQRSEKTGVTSFFKIDGSLAFETKGGIYDCGWGLMVVAIDGKGMVLDLNGNIIARDLDNVLLSGKYVFVARDKKIGYFINPCYKYLTADDMLDVTGWAKDGVNWALSNGYVYPKTSIVFGANYECPRWEVVNVIWQAMGRPEPTLTQCPFDDISEGSEYYKAVMWAYENKIAAGLTDTTFGPDETVNRAQAVTFIHRAANLPASSGSNPFADVKSGEYYANAVIWASENRIAAGKSDTSFDPYGAVTRAEMLAFLYRWKNK